MLRGATQVDKNMRSNNNQEKQKWYQYLPVDNGNTNNFASLSRDEPRESNYLLSLQRRLQKLFRQEKQMLKQRYFKNQANQSIYDPKYSSKHKTFEGSYNIQNMDRKIRQLEQRYRRPKQDTLEKIEERPLDTIMQSGKKQYKKQKSVERKCKMQTEKANYENQPTYNQNFRTQSIEQCMNRQKYLEEQVETLKKSVQQLHDNNKSLLKRIQNREQKKKHKHRTKQLLREILHKLEFINIEIRSAKKKDERSSSSGKLGKLQKQTNEIHQEFEKLRLLYKHIQNEKTLFEKKQLQIEKKIQTLTKQKTEQKP